jgi:hypothetical protein
MTFFCVRRPARGAAAERYSPNTESTMALRYRLSSGALIRLRLLRGNCHILLAIELKCHRRRREAGADIDLPYFLKRGVVKGRDCAVEQSEE